MQSHCGYKSLWLQCSAQPIIISVFPYNGQCPEGATFWSLPASRGDRAEPRHPPRLSPVPPAVDPLHGHSDDWPTITDTLHTPLGRWYDTCRPRLPAHPRAVAGMEGLAGRRWNMPEHQQDGVSTMSPSDSGIDPDRRPGVKEDHPIQIPQVPGLGRWRDPPGCALMSQCSMA